MFVPPGTGGGAGDNLIYSSLLQHLNAMVVNDWFNEDISDWLVELIIEKPASQPASSISYFLKITKPGSHSFTDWLAHTRYKIQVFFLGPLALWGTN